MSSLGFDDLSLTDWVIFGVLGIVTTALLVGFLSSLNNSITEEWNANDQLPQASKDIVNSNNNNFNGWLDKGLFALFVALALACLFVAKASNISPAFWFILFIIFILVGIASAWLTNYYLEAFTALNINAETAFPLSFHIINNLVLYAVIIMFTSFILSRMGGGADI